MHTSCKIRRLAALGVVGLLSTVGVSAVAARIAPPDIGRATQYADEGCFALNEGGVVNTCTSEKLYEMPLTIDSTGSKKVKVNAYSANSSRNVCCAAGARNADLSGAVHTAWKCLPDFNVGSTIELDTIDVPKNGALYAVCEVGRGAQINTVTW